MGVTLHLDRKPVTVPLTGAFEGVTLTLWRLSSLDFATARMRTMETMRDQAKLEAMLERQGIRSPFGDPIPNPLFMAGLAVIVGHLECGVAAIIGLKGVRDEAGRDAPPTREVLETLFFNDEFERQAGAAIDHAAAIAIQSGGGR